MKQVFRQAGKVCVDDIPAPALTDNVVLVANAFSLISAGTEAAAVKAKPVGMLKRAIRNPGLVARAAGMLVQEGPAKTLQAARPPAPRRAPLGYSSAGIVLAVGRNVLDVNVGDRVACGGGQFAQHAGIIAVTRNLTAQVPANVSLDHACFATLAAVPMHAVRRAGVQFGETVVVLGLGLLGLLAVQIARAGGYRVIGFDLDESRTELARAIGAERAFVLGKCDPVSEIDALTHGFGADAVLVCAATSSSEPVNLAFDLCRPRGRVVAVGAFGMELDRSKMYAKELDLVMSTSYGPGRYDPVYEEAGVDYPIGHVRWTEGRNMDEFLRLLGAGKVDVGELVHAAFPVDEAASAYAALREPHSKPAILLSYDAERHVKQPGRIHTVEVRPASAAPIEGRIRVGVIGAGGFVSRYRLPFLKELSDQYSLRAISTVDGPSCGALAREFGAVTATTDYEEILRDPEVDLVLVGTRHDLHFPLVKKSLEAGKRVFVEKPLCLRPEELDEVADLSGTTGLPVIVGFNRRYAPLTVVLESRLRQETAPFVILYRANAGHIPADHWAQDGDVGGGRIIGEACHFIDVVRFLVGPDIAVSDVQAAVAPADGVRIVARDNFVASISFADGSIASLVYTSLGSRDMEKERVEVFAGGKSYVLHDYLWLQGCGCDTSAWRPSSGRIKGDRLILPEQDKGWREELVEAARFLRGEGSRSLRLADAVQSMAATFRIEGLLREGTPQE